MRNNEARDPPVPVQLPGRNRHLNQTHRDWNGQQCYQHDPIPVGFLGQFVFPSPEHSGEADHQCREHSQGVGRVFNQHENVHTEPEEHDASEAGQDYGDQDVFLHLHSVLQNDRQVD